MSKTHYVLPKWITEARADSSTWTKSVTKPPELGSFDEICSEWASYDGLWLTQSDTEESLRWFAQKVLEHAATIALEQRCERDTPWDLACLAIAKAIRNGGKRE
jgi:hypothetical protein